MSYQKAKDNIHTFLLSKEKQLKIAGITNASQELRWFLQYVFSIKKEYFVFKKNFIITNKEYKKLNDFINRRLKQEPFQYIVKSAPFYGLDLYVDSNVLIPRPESEIIIDIIKKKQTFFHSALDIGTGSGNLALALAINKISKNITAIDISKEAIQVAKKNFSKYQIKKIQCFQCNFLTTKFKKSFDLIVSNPPYISSDEYLKLDKTIKDFEPQNALTDNSTGLTFYHKLSKSIDFLLKPKGILLLEIGLEKNKNIIEKIFKKHSIAWHKDLQNNNRVIEINK